MYSKFTREIRRGAYVLADMTDRITTAAQRGWITPEQHDELRALAYRHANAAATINVAAALMDHEMRLRSLEELLLGDADDDLPPQPPALEPPYISGTPTVTGDRWSFGGVNYTVVGVPEGQVCVWSPAEYPAYWRMDDVQPVLAAGEGE